MGAKRDALFEAAELLRVNRQMDHVELIKMVHNATGVPMAILVASMDHTRDNDELNKMIDDYLKGD